MTAREYQDYVIRNLGDIFDEESIKSEWDSVKCDSHSGNHGIVYAPLIFEDEEFIEFLLNYKSNLSV